MCFLGAYYGEISETIISTINSWSGRASYLSVSSLVGNGVLCTLSLGTRCLCRGRSGRPHGAILAPWPWMLSSHCALAHAWRWTPLSCSAASHPRPRLQVLRRGEAFAHRVGSHAWRRATADGAMASLASDKGIHSTHAVIPRPSGAAVADHPRHSCPCVIAAPIATGTCTKSNRYTHNLPNPKISW
jgi:hypothetical protein